MVKLNENYSKLPGSYLFAEVARRTAAFAAAHPEADIIKLGIGDVTLPLPAACVSALERAADVFHFRNDIFQHVFEFRIAVESDGSQDVIEGSEQLAFAADFDRNCLVFINRLDSRIYMDVYVMFLIRFHQEFSHFS